MTITSGTRLGPYEVVSPLGAGGMGEVWKARDTRLDRSVAIKVLPAEFAENAQLKLRFEREAKTISQLNHPHICTLYDVGDGYLVMELLEGESLADRLTKGPLPLDQVLRYGIEIAEALEKAHKAGITHRDLKPGNIMLTKSGAKLLDFGLAKPTAVLSPQSSVLETVHKPLTQEGSIVGTFQYMAPEQIEGAEVDARTDIFALGAVLYEMATGRRAFDGKSKASLIANILGGEPQPISAITPMTPATFDRVVRKCLEKEPDRRWQSAADVATELRWVAETPATEASRPRRALLWQIATTLAIATALALGALVWRDASARRNTPPVRTTILPPEKLSFAFGISGAPPAISPDGTQVVFGASGEGRRTLWIRRIDSLVPHELAGTEGASYPFWSPDSRSIGFFAATSLKKMEVNGGAAITICDVNSDGGRGGSWSGKTIIFAGRFTGISRVSAAGGTPVELTKLDNTTGSHRWPEFLPDGGHFLFLASPSGSEDPNNAIAIGSVAGTPWKRLIASADEPHYVDGAIVFTRQGVLTAQAFDARSLVTRGDPVPLEEPQIDGVPSFSRSDVSVSRNGTAVYEPGTRTATTQLVWLDRSGKSLGTVGDPATYVTMAMAPDRKRLLTSIAIPPVANIWMIDLERDVPTRITFNKGIDALPLWSPDGRRMVYTSRQQKGQESLILRDLTTGAEEVLLKGSFGAYISATSWSSDGQRILFSMVAPKTAADIWWMSLSDRQPHLYLQTRFVESGARFSADGKWVAYQSGESGNPEVYIAPFPPTGAKWQVSTGGGAVPRWTKGGRELTYLVPGMGGQMMAVPVALTSTAPQIGRPVELFRYHVGGLAGVGMYDVTADGERFIVNASNGEAATPAPLVLVQHFDHELRAALEQRP